MKTLLVSIEEAARIVGIGRDRAYEMVKSGEWETVDIGKRQRKVSRAFLYRKYGSSSSSNSIDDHFSSHTSDNDLFGSDPVDVEVAG
jgi:excisionase family DNA binding protein